MERTYGVLKPLLAQVALWREKEELCCLITIDSIGFKKELCDKLRRRVGEAIGVNRRVGNQNLDNRLGILKICDAKSGDIKLILLRVTAHCNALKRDNDMISPDYFGDIRDVLKAHYQCPIMVIQGAAGNIAPKYFKSAETPIDARGEQFIRSETALEDIAQEVFKQAVPIIDTIEVKCDAFANMYSKSITLYAEVPTYERACIVAKEAMDNCGIDGTDWLAEVSRLNSIGIKTQEETVEVQYLQIGEGCLCGVPHEIMVEFAINTMERCKDEFSYFNRVFLLVRESAERLIDFVVNNR